MDEDELMSVDRWIGLAGLIMTALGLWLTLRPRKPAPNLVTEVRTTPLYINRPVRDLVVSWKGERLNEPVLLELLLWNQGPGDIPRSAFDGGHVIVEVPKTRPVGLTSDGATRGTRATATADGFQFELPAQLLKQREGARATVICDGRPGPVVTKIRLSGVETGRSPATIRWRSALRRSFAMYLVVAGLIVVATLLNEAADMQPGSGLPSLLGFLAIFLVGGTLGGAWVIRSAESVGPSDKATEKVDFGLPSL